jgi:hypothetical protein
MRYWNGDRRRHILVVMGRRATAGLIDSFHTSAVAGLVGLLGGGCSIFGGQTGEGSFTAGCVDAAPEQVPLADTTDLGFAPDAALALVNVPRSAAASWRLSDGTAVAAQVELAVRSASTTARLVRSIALVDPSTPEDVQCAGRIEVDVEADLALERAGQSVRASCPAVVRASSKYVAQLTAELATSGLSGDPQISVPEGNALAGFAIQAALSAASVSGAFQAVIAGPPLGEQRDNVAVWPADSPCQADELASPVDESLFEFSPRVAVGLMDAQLPLVWNDGSSTTVTLRAAPSSSFACVSYGAPTANTRIFRDSSVRSTNQPLMRVPITLSVETEDGRWVKDFGTSLHVEPLIDGGMDRIWVQHVASYASTEALSADSGLRLGDAVLGQGESAATLYIGIMADAKDGRAAPHGIMTVSAPRLLERAVLGSGED